ncbi:hypothetical protein EVAR_6219_1 [Eumeta japonica]|uniref:Uncharacterized protein n=1 Tax=Eumeta variegata TaxID=151549 RepID=A0A4C1YXZ5_EUMVA|nr:hypothetical protein EVAR_6219_1 [Eumeta japonica]
MMTGLGSSAIKGDFDPYQDSDPFGPQRFDIGINLPPAACAAGASASTSANASSHTSKRGSAARCGSRILAAPRAPGPPCTHRPLYTRERRRFISERASLGARRPDRYRKHTLRAAALDPAHPYSIVLRQFGIILNCTRDDDRATTFVTLQWPDAISSPNTSFPHDTLFRSRTIGTASTCKRIHSDVIQRHELGLMTMNNVFRFFDIEMRNEIVNSHHFRPRRRATRLRIDGSILSRPPLGPCPCQFNFRERSDCEDIYSKASLPFVQAVTESFYLHRPLKVTIRLSKTI